LGPVAFQTKGKIYERKTTIYIIRKNYAGSYRGHRIGSSKTAEEAAKSRREMEAMNQAMRISAAKREHIQLTMAAEQAESNFRNTLLATLPLLKSEGERIQFLANSCYQN
jgi:hypothetical protein